MPIMKDATLIILPRRRHVAALVLMRARSLLMLLPIMPLFDMMRL